MNGIELLVKTCMGCAMAAIVILIVFVVIQIIKNWRVDHFFAKHSCSHGIVKAYEYEEAHSSMTFMPTKIGEMMLMVPLEENAAEAYRIEVECRDEVINYLASYKIPKADFEKEIIGSDANIQAEWIPIGYEILGNHATNH